MRYFEPGIPGSPLMGSTRSRSFIHFVRLPESANSAAASARGTSISISTMLFTSGKRLAPGFDPARGERQPALFSGLAFRLTGTRHSLCQERRTGPAQVLPARTGGRHETLTQTICVWPRARSPCRPSRAARSRNPIRRGSCAGWSDFRRAAAPTSSRASLRVALETGFGQPVIVENRPGAASNISVQRSPSRRPTAIRCCSSPASAAVNVSLFDKLPFDLMRDIAPVAGLIDFPLVMVANPSMPANHPRSDRARQDQSGQDHHWLVRHRLDLACRRRAVQDGWPAST